MLKFHYKKIIKIPLIIIFIPIYNLKAQKWVFFTSKSSQENMLHLLKNVINVVMRKRL